MKKLLFQLQLLFLFNNNKNKINLNKIIKLIYLKIILKNKFFD